MKIDKKMLPMKLHYILRYAGTGPLMPFLTVIARQKGMTNEIVGLMWTIMPFFSILIKTSAGAIADYLRAHRTVFLTAIIVMGTSLTAIYWSPEIDNERVHENVSRILRCNDTSYHNEEGYECVGGELPMSEYANHYEFWVLFILLLTQFCAFMVVLDLQETICFQMLGDKPQKYGLQRLWGTASYGLTAMIGGALVDWYSKDLPEKDYLPVHIMVAVFLTMDVIVVTRLKFTVPDKKISKADVTEVLKKPSVVLILITTMVLGMCMGMLVTFQFLLVEDTAALWDSSFVYQRLLQGLMLGIQCLLSEVPCFFLTGKIISFLGYPKSFLTALLGFSLRFSLYAVVTNPWWYLPIELLHGASFALSLGCTTMYANSVTPAGAEATMQAVFGSALHCASGLGGLVGGWLFHITNGWKAFFIMGTGVGMYALLFLGIHSFVSRMDKAERDDKQETSKKEEMTLIKA